MKPLKMFAIDALWRITSVTWRFADWLSDACHDACAALEAAYLRLDELEDGE